ncbi:uncharacterized protein LOC127426177 isoform X3 [Myxocyprinus asiaticus]|uniref:uncharacterized protein LOC127426177 isoform X3 n=1 Tax=Myxocyprinus asiaticus TaxID=70543 RepID=UPI002222DD39|nr:uncharacterized protein LOC127426177 isoform X3 [Myxocyprinus asiaticus]
MKAGRVIYQRQERSSSLYCCVPQCANSSRYNAEISFHSFPVDSAVRAQWLVKICRDHFSPTQNTRVCSRHFERDDFVLTSGGLRRLKKGALPCFFAWNNYTLPTQTPNVWDTAKISPADSDLCAVHAAPELDHSVTPATSVMEALEEKKEGSVNMETEEVAPEAPVEPPTEVVDANTEANKEPTASAEIQDIQNHVTDNNKEEAVTETQGESAKVTEGETDPHRQVTDNPSCDWLEPLEEDCDEADAQSGDQDGTESLAGSELRGGRSGGFKPRRRPQCEADEGWEDCPSLGEGWKRKQVFRRSGTSEGRSDTYYTSPCGHKVRSRVELLRYVDPSLDLTNFDFKTGKILDDAVPKRGRRRKVESSLLYFGGSAEVPNKLMDAGGWASSPGSSANLSAFQREGPYVKPKVENSTTVTDTTVPSFTTPPNISLTEIPAKPTAPLLGGSDGLVNGSVGTSKPFLSVCVKCNKTITFEEGQTMCQNCRLEVNIPIEKGRKPYKKWVPCGRCRGCQVMVDCGKCVSCRNGKLRLRLNIRSRKIVKCRKRKCLHPIRRDKSGKVNPQTSGGQFSNTFGSISTASSIQKFQPSVADFEESQSSLAQYSDSEDVSLFLGGNDGDYGYEKHLLPMDENQSEMLIPEERGRPRPRYTYSRGRPRNRRLWDFEVSDNEAERYETPNPFSGSAQMVKRDRLLIPNYNGKAYSYSDIPNSYMLNNIPLYSFQNVEISHQLHVGRVEMIKENGLQGSGINSRGLLSVRPGIQQDFLSAARCESVPFPPSYGFGAAEQDVESSPSITQIFSMADSDPATKGIDIDHELMQLLRSLRSTVLPVLWYCVVMEGPRLQLMQCSKRSTMADTIVHIEPNFYYHISVQEQPLLPTHKLYDSHPPRLTTTTEVIALLEDLEKHAVCQGFAKKCSTPGPEPVLPERAATCDFLILPEAECCPKCSTLQQG